MADSKNDDRSIGDEAVRRGLLTRENLAEALDTQRLAVEAGLPISLAEVLIQRQYLNTVQIEALQSRLREQAQAPAPAPAPQPGPALGLERPPRPNESTRNVPRRPSTHGSTTGPKAPIEPPSSAHSPLSPFPSIPAAPDAPPAPVAQPPSARVPPSGPHMPVADSSALAGKRGSGRAAAVSPGTGKRASSTAAKAVLPASAEGMPPPSGKRSSAQSPAISAPSNKRSSSIFAKTTSPEPPPGPSQETKPESSAPATPTATTEAAPPVRSRTRTATAAAKPAERSSKTVLGVILVLLLLVGSNTVTWMVARNTEPEPVYQIQAMACGPAFDPLAYWLVIGPFPVKNGGDLDTVHDPENPERDVTAPLKGAKGPLKWTLARMQNNSISFIPYLGKHETCNAYGLTYIQVPSETKAVLGIGSDDSICVWLNGEKVHEYRELRKCVVDQDHVPVTLNAGVNEILVKIGQDTTEWGFAVTLRAPDSKPLRGLKGCLPLGIAIPSPIKKPVTPVIRPTAPPKPIVKPTPRPIAKPVTATPKPTAPAATTTAPPATPPAKPTTPIPTPPAKPTTPETTPATPPAAAPLDEPAEPPA